MSRLTTSARTARGATRTTPVRLSNFALLSIAACTASSTAPDPVCQAGTSAECRCLDGDHGYQLCRASGTGYEECDCTGRDRRDGGTETGCTDPECMDTDVSLVPDLEVGDESVGNLDLGETDVASPPDVAPTDTPGPDATGAVALGDRCDVSSDCASNICIEVAPQGVPEPVCTTPCCHEEECPSGFGCLQIGAGRWCLPSRIFPAGTTFLARTGDSCGPSGSACKSGICDASNDMCRGTCCTDSDCGVAPCHWTQSGGSLRTWCNPLALLGDQLRTGAACWSEESCASGVCAQHSDGEFRCADLCCRRSDCPPGYTCGLVGASTGDAVRACVPAGPGSLPDGSPCSDDGGSCFGGQCVSGLCATLCCHDDDCADGRVCRPALTPDGIVAPVCAERR